LDAGLTITAEERIVFSARTGQDWTFCATG
jgi:hypothetical protein